MTTKHIQITDFQAGRMVEQEFNPFDRLYEAAFEARGKSLLGASILEAALGTPDGANMLRDGIRYMAFSMYNEVDPGISGFTQFETSAKPQEEYLRDAVIGVLPKYKSGDSTQRIRSSFEGGVIIKNEQYRGMVEIEMDDIRFDRIGKIAQMARELGRAGRMTEAKYAFDVLTTTANYVRSATANDNDVGANTQTLAFNGVNFETAKRIVGTAKDRKSGAYLGFNGDTLIVGPALEVAAKQLLMSDEIRRVGGNTTNETRGTGTTNPYFGMVNNIIVSPWFSNSYAWALFDSRMKPVIFQRVEPFNVLQEGANVTSESFLERDSIRYVVKGYFGVGMVDDRCIFYSDSSSAPTVS